MAKGDDALAKKKNKAIRKRNRRAGAGTTDAIEGVQSHKRRRKAGTRRVCEAMCYSLPTPEDPFLNRKKHQKNRDSAPKIVDNDEPMSDTDRRVERALKTKLSNGVKANNNKKSPGSKAQAKSPGSNGQAKSPGSNGQAKSPAPLKKVVWDPKFDLARGGQKEDAVSVAGRAFQEAVSAVCEDRDSVGEFERQWWHGCSQGASMLGSGHGTSCIQAYAVGAAPHVANQRLLHGSTRGTSALILVNSKEQAHSVREIFKPLKKVLNIHSISLHSDASIEHQVTGLAMQTPDVVIATPERLCQLLSRNALTLSTVSYVVVDGLDELINGDCQEQLESIRQQLQKGVQFGILSKAFPAVVVIATGNWLQHPIVRAAIDKSVPASSVCITQSVSVVTTEEAKLSKINKILAELKTSLDRNEITGELLLVVQKREKFPLMKELLRNHNFIPHVLGESDTTPRKEKRGVLVTLFDEDHSPASLANYEVAINYDYCWPIHHYTRILTAMARSSVKGRMETVCSGAAQKQANDLVHVLESCGQVVPKPLILIARTAALVTE